MKPIKMQKYSAVASLKRRCQVGNQHLKNSSNYSSSSLKGFSFSQHGGFQKAPTGASCVFSKSNHEGSYLSQNGGSHMSLFGSSHNNSHEGPNTSHQKSSTTICHGAASKSHHGNKNIGLHGKSGYKGVSFSKRTSISHGGMHIRHSRSSHFGDHSNWKNSGLLNINEKETMKILNERLSSYLEKVNSLEKENTQLERKISEWYENNAPSKFPDSSKYFKIITDLQTQISSTAMEKNKIILQIDNARLASDDLKNKYEMELQLSNSTMTDVKSLQRFLEGLNRERCDLDRDVHNLQEELQQMKVNHEEEASSLHSQLGARVNVELNAAPSMDLNSALSKIRDQYENLMDKNLMESENMFLQRSEELAHQVESGAEQMQSVLTKGIELKRTIQTVEIELQSQLSMTSALKHSLEETQTNYGSQIGQLQSMINNIESQLSEVRSDLERTNHKYKILMDQKNYLEMEIATYKRLLEGHDIQVKCYHSTSGKDASDNGHDTK
ncbi:keratin, type I cytoskeletal 19-like [Pelobates fuscus]|uniref:keratin, type I cytoskeletal 19-like n=1 Tax=Pelobates fuscus TaxID=191477 RepID=UPI002FE488E7